MPRLQQLLHLQHQLKHSQPFKHLANSTSFVTTTTPTSGECKWRLSIPIPWWASSNSICAQTLKLGNQLVLPCGWNQRLSSLSFISASRSATLSKSSRICKRNSIDIVYKLLLSFSIILFFSHSFDSIFSLFILIFSHSSLPILFVLFSVLSSYTVTTTLLHSNHCGSLKRWRTQCFEAHHQQLTAAAMSNPIERESRWRWQHLYSEWAKRCNWEAIRSRTRTFSRKHQHFWYVMDSDVFIVIFSSSAWILINWCSKFISI